MNHLEKRIRKLERTGSDVGAAVVLVFAGACPDAAVTDWIASNGALGEREVFLVNLMKAKPVAVSAMH